MNRVSRRGFLQGASAVASVVGLGGVSSLFAEAPGAPGHMMFLGTQTDKGDSKGIYAYRWNSANGSLEKIGLAAEVQMPTFLTLSPNRKFLFAANETETFMGEKSGGVSGFRINPGSSTLTPINQQLSEGTGTCYISTDHTGKVLLCANYAGGSGSSFRISPDGHISKAVSTFHYTGHGPNAARQEKPHVHRAIPSPGNKFVLFNDLGLDGIHIYKLDPATAELTPNQPAMWHAPAGTGPRALQFHPSGKWAYCVTEMGSNVILLAWDEATGTLTTKQQLEIVPKDYHGDSAGCDIAIDREGKFAYVSERFYDMVVVYRIDPTNGRLTEIQRMPPHGHVSRHITIDPSGRWLLSANQESDTITIFARDPKTGKLADHSDAVHQSRPQCLLFL